MKELTIMTSELFGEVRFAEIDGKPYAVGKDIATALGYSNPTKAVSVHCKGVSKMGIPTSGGIQEMSMIPEGDIYRLIIRSKLPGADKFERWVFDEVIPQIRKTGGYIPVTQEMSDAEIMAKALLISQRTIEQKNTIIKEQEERIEYLEDKLTLTQGQTNMIVSALKTKFYQIYGTFGWASDKRFIAMKNDILNHFNANKWADINQREFDNVLNYIGRMER